MKVSLFRHTRIFAIIPHPKGFVCTIHISVLIKVGRKIDIEQTIRTDQNRELYSMPEFNSKTVRKTSAYDKKYLEHDFGAAETMEINDKLINLLYV